jgi:hypothetical protein
MLSASKAKFSVLYYGCKLAAPLQTTLEEQPSPTLVTTNNITAQGLTIGTVTPKASKSMDQRFHWLSFGTHNANSNIFGARVYSIALTTPAKIMHKNIIKMFTHFFVFDNTTFPRQ